LDELACGDRRIRIHFDFRDKGYFFLGPKQNSMTMFRRVTWLQTSVFAFALLNFALEPALSQSANQVDCPSIQTEVAFADHSALRAGEQVSARERKGARITNVPTGLLTKAPQGVLVVDGPKLGTTQAFGPYGRQGKGLVQADQWFAGLVTRLCSAPFVVTADKTVTVPVFLAGGSMLLTDRVHKRKEWLSFDRRSNLDGTHCGAGSFVEVEKTTVFVVRNWDQFCQVADDKVTILSNWRDKDSQRIDLETGRSLLMPSNADNVEISAVNPRLRALTLRREG
jgi:hypothetical protein